MVRHILLLAILWMVFPSPAHACVLIPVPEISRGEKRHWSRQQTRALTREANARLISESVNFAAELAELLVPNVRPIRLEWSSCGPAGETDFAGGIRGVSDIVADMGGEPRLAHIDSTDYFSVIRQFDGETILGQSCNSEFRSKFSAFLKKNMTEDDLRSAWRFLTARKRNRATFGPVYTRLMTFDRGSRWPPVHWWGQDEWIREDIDRFVKKDISGRRLAEQISAFWAEREPSLEVDESVCPQTSEAVRRDRMALVDKILQERERRRLKVRLQSSPSPGPSGKNPN